MDLRERLPMRGISEVNLGVRHEAILGGVTRLEVQPSACHGLATNGAQERHQAFRT
jgi:hypothetical protein